MGNTSLCRNRGLIRIDGRSQGCAYNMTHRSLIYPWSKSTFRLPKEPGNQILFMGSPTRCKQGFPVVISFQRHLPRMLVRAPQARPCRRFRRCFPKDWGEEEIYPSSFRVRRMRSSAEGCLITSSLLPTIPLGTSTKSFSAWKSGGKGSLFPSS